MNTPNVTDADLELANSIFGEPPKPIEESGDVTAGLVTPTEVEGSTEEGGTGVPAKSDPSRYEYWQSAAMKRERELEEARMRLAEMEAQLNPTTKQETFNLQPPTKPSKPASYDPAEAYSDPTSESFKYRVSLDEYRDALDDYRLQKEMYREKVEQTRAEQQAMQEQARQRDLALRAKLKARGMTDLQAQDFIQTMSDPQTWNEDNVIRFWSTLRSQQSPQKQQQRQQSGASTIPPLTNATTRGAQVGDMDELTKSFNADLFKSGKRTK